MDSDPELDRRTTELIIRVLAGEGGSQDVQHLNEMLLEEASFASRVVEIVGQDAWLAWSGVSDADGAAVLADQAAATPAPATVRPHRSRPVVRRDAGWAALAASLLLIIGALSGVIGSRLVADLTGKTPGASVGLGNDLDRLGYVGHIVEASSCKWSPDFNAYLGSGGALRRGESLNLLEGVAELRLDQFDNSVKLCIEGPAGLVLTADGGCSISHGKVTIDAINIEEAFLLDTPNGQVVVGRPASIGVSVDGREVSVHIFSGEANIIVPWGSGFDSQFFDLQAGESLSLTGQSEGELVALRGKSEPGQFASQTSMGWDQLRISDEYVESVLALEPLVYWRFDGSEGDSLNNLTGGQLSGRVNGTIRTTEERGNRYVSLGGGISDEELTAYLMSSGPLQGDFSEGYSLEIWIKPGHYHNGTVAGLIKVPSNPESVTKHGMLLELGGPRTTKPAIEQPGRLRFLHRSPPEEDLNIGVSCFSSSPYQLRMWQHVVAVKAEQQIRLYVDGQLSATADDSTELSPGLSLIVGQIDENRQTRQLIGQIDELAFYPKPLTADDVALHYRLVRD